MSIPTYQVGDIVQLKSGGPKMTIGSEADSKGFYFCKWFAGSKLEDGRFKPETLVKIEDEKKKP